MASYILAAQTRTLIGAKTGIESAAAGRGQCPRWGHSRQFDDVRATSVFPLIATTPQTRQHIAKVPLATDAFNS
jgi:hypothetical protein